MKIDFGQMMYALTGEPMQEQWLDGDKKPQERDLTLGRACINALLTVSDEPQTGAQKFDRFKLAMRIGNDEQPMEISAAEIVLIKDQAGAAYTAWAVGTIWTMLEAAGAVL